MRFPGSFSSDHAESVARYGQRHVGMKITGGSRKGMNIEVVSGGARYTSSKVREAIFDYIGDISEGSVLDLFAGSASFSIEALSRGAASCTAVEKDLLMARMASKNLRNLGLDKSCLVLNMDVRYAVPFLAKKGEHYDLIFMDPPYEKGFVMEALGLLKKHPLHREGAWIVVEHSKREVPQVGVECACRAERRKYGDTMVTFFDVQPDPE